MSSLFFSLRFLLSSLAFLSIIIFPLGILYVIIASPYWFWEGVQLMKGRTTQEKLDQRTPFAFFSAPFRFYFCKVFRLPYKF